MTEELSKTEARQGDRRRTNMTVLVVGTALGIILLAIIYAAWA
jgi:hypothetical protein